MLTICLDDILYIQTTEKTMKDKIPTTMRFRPEYKEKLKRLSDNEDIPMTRYLENLLDKVKET